MGPTRSTVSGLRVYPTRMTEPTQTRDLCERWPELHDVVSGPPERTSGHVLNEVHRQLHDTVREGAGGGFCPECRSARVLLGAFVTMTAAVLWAAWEWVQHDTLMNLVARL